MRNERGIALVITLLVVALLTITVVEFTYSVEVDQHMARNALYSLQASLLVRSGITMGEAFLLRDTDPQVDAFTEEWCPQVGPEGQSCLIDETTSELVVPENMRLRVQIFDESGKVNINMMRPLNIQDWRAYQQNPDGPGRTHAWQALLQRLLEGRGVDPEVSESIVAYWGRLIELYFPGPPAPGSVPGTPTPVRTVAVPTPGALWQLDFPSLDDASVIPGLTPAAIRHLRPVLTALDTRRWAQVNINTAPRYVLDAIIGQGEVVENIISQRQEAPLKDSDKASLLAPLAADPANPTTQYARTLLGVRSAYFLIRASAIINPNPVTGKGGIGRSAAMLVRRDAKPGVSPNAPAGTQRWTLTRLDWQKEGGAALFQQKPEHDPGTGEASSDML